MMIYLMSKRIIPVPSYQFDGKSNTNGNGEFKFERRVYIQKKKKQGAQEEEVLKAEEHMT